jgi:methionyl-tRNA formyltransferase
MTGVNSTGVTLQTMDEVSFDHGMILAQTPPNGLQVPSLDTCTYEDLLEFITPKAAEMLVQGIRDRAYVPPLKAVGWYESDHLVPAPKITPKHRHIDWESWEASRIHRHHRALGRLWNRVYVDSRTETTKRLIYEDVEVAPMPDVLAEWLAESRPDATGKIIPQESDSLVRFVVYQDTAGAPKPLPYIVDGEAVVFAAFPPSMGKGIRVNEITMEGQRKKAASKVMQNFQGREAWELMKGSGESFGVNPVPPLVRGIGTTASKVH